MKEKRNNGNKIEKGSYKQRSYTSAQEFLSTCGSVGNTVSFKISFDFFYQKKMYFLLLGKYVFIDACRKWYFSAVGTGIYTVEERDHGFACRSLRIKGRSAIKAIFLKQ